MEVFWLPGNAVVISIGGQELHMSRIEAETLFVDLGNVLQDMDISYWADMTGDNSEQPDMEGI